MFALLDAQSSSSTALPVQWDPPQHIQAPSSCDTASHQQQTLLSVLDALAAPTVFMQQALVFADPIGAADLASALQLVLLGYPALGYRLSTEQDGRLCLQPLESPAAVSITFLQGTSSSTLQQLLQLSSTTSSCDSAEPNATPTHTAQQQQQQQLVKLPELPDALYGHLPGALLPDYLDNPELPLVHVALVQLSGGGCVLGLRLSHLMGDWSSARLLLRSVAAAYSYIRQREQQQGTEVTSSVEALCGKPSSAAATQATRQHLAAASSSSSNIYSDVPCLSHLPRLTPAAPLLNRLVAVTREQLPSGLEPVRLKLQQPEDVALFQQLAQLSSSRSSSSKSDHQTLDDGANGSSSRQPHRLTYHVLPDRLQQLKKTAQADLAAAAAARGTADESSSGSRRACTSHNVLLARLLQAFCSLPGRAGVPHDVAVSVDMRGRLPLQQQQQPQQLDAAFGNFVASAILEGAVPERSSLGELTVQLRAAAERGGELWLPDLAWASGILHVTDAALTGLDQGQTHQQHAVQEQGEENTTNTQRSGAANLAKQLQPQVTWRRLHAMGPRTLLQQQMQLGLLASLSTTQWRLDYAADANFAGQLPLLAVPSFSQPQPYPLLLMQQAPAGCGGGLLLHVWLDGDELVLLQQAVEAMGGL